MTSLVASTLLTNSYNYCRYTKFISSGPRLCWCLRGSCCVCRWWLCFTPSSLPVCSFACMMSTLTVAGHPWTQPLATPALLHLCSSSWSVLLTLLTLDLSRTIIGNNTNFVFHVCVQLKTVGVEKTIPFIEHSWKWCKGEVLSPLDHSCTGSQDES